MTAAVTRDGTDLAAELADLVRDAEGGWTVRTDSTWAHALPTGGTHRIQGWKLHLSATVGSAHDVLRAAAPVLVASQTPFKVARDLGTVRRLVAGDCPRPNAGKIITVYPGNDEQAVALAAALDAATAGLPGPRILTDRPLAPGSLVHYRFGAFRGQWHLDPDGTVHAGLVEPDGTVVPDRREVGYVAPPWAVNPFPAPAPATATRGGVLIADRFAVTEAIRHSYRGGVYLGRDTRTGQQVVVKQARAHVVVGSDHEDARGGLRREFAALQHLASSGWTPAPISLTEQGGDAFLVEEFLGGQTLRSWVAEGYVEGVPARPRSVTSRMSVQLARLLADIHGAGVVLRDLTPNNLLVLPGDRLRLIDLELSVPPGGDPDVGRAFTPGYAPPEQRAGEPATPADDLHALGACLLYLHTGADPILSPAAPTLDDWLAVGVRRAAVGEGLADVVARLLSPEATARPAAAVVRDELRRMRTSTPVPGVADVVREALADGPVLEAPVADEAVDRVLDRLLTDISLTDQRLVPTSGFGETTLDTCVQHGAAGVLAVLVQAARLRPDARIHRAVADVSGWIERRAENRPATGVPGLYFGQAGVAWALIDAAVELGDDQLLRRSTDGLLALGRDGHSSDVTHGLAGLCLALQHVAVVTGDGRVRDAVGDVATRLQQRATRDEHGISWRTPAGAPSSFADRRFHGFAHGTAGIGYALQRAGVLLGEPSFGALADEAARALVTATTWHGPMARYGSGPEHPTPDEVGTFWCNGGMGVAAFLLELPHADGVAGVLHGAAIAALAERERHGVAYCHGLSGNADVLLDVASATGDPRYRDYAARLLHGMWSLRTTDERGLLLADEPGRVVADFHSGYAGALSVLLRFCAGGPRLFVPKAAS